MAAEFVNQVSDELNDDMIAGLRPSLDAFERLPRRLDVLSHKCNVSTEHVDQL